jgi:hypothetical protein
MEYTAGIMKLALRSLLMTVIALLLSNFSAAQMGIPTGHPPSLGGVFSPVVGSGAAYEIVRKDGHKLAFDIAAVGKDGPGYWIEYTMQSSRGSNYSKHLVTRESDNLIMGRTISQVQGQPPTEMPGIKWHPKADMRGDAENLGSDTVMTPAGPFSCQHFRSKKDGSEFWISDKVSPWSVVKMAGNDETMTLTKIITDAKTHITGTPISMEKMNRQRMITGRQ